MKKPNFFIVGQPKAGTTALHNFLSQHPDIFMSKFKEPFFFCKDFHQESDQHYGFRKFFPFRDEASYLKLFAQADSYKIVGESSAFYLYSQIASQEIYNFNHKAKIIILLRNPIDWLYSLHNQYVNTTTENERDFTQALALESLRKQGKKIPNRVQAPSWVLYLEMIKYYDQIKRFYDLFSSSQIKTIIFEDFKADNQKTYQEILDFLEINSSFIANYKSVNCRAKPRSYLLNQIIYSPLIRSVSQKLFTPKAYDYIAKNVVEKVLWQKTNKSAVPLEIKQQLAEKVKPEVIKIADFLNTDLCQKWGYENI